MKRAILIVLDSLGVGALPDAENYGDAGAHTLDHIAEAMTDFKIPNLVKLGLGNIDGVTKVTRENSPSRSLRQAGGTVKGQGYHHRALGDRRSVYRDSLQNLPKVSEGIHGPPMKRPSVRKRWETTRRRARRSLRHWGRSTKEPASPSSIPPRTAYSRSRQIPP